MIGKQFEYDGEIWTVFRENVDGYSCVCTTGKESGSWRFTFDELREILK